MGLASDSEDDDIWEINCKPCVETLSPRSATLSPTIANSNTHDVTKSSPNTTHLDPGRRVGDTHTRTRTHSRSVSHSTPPSGTTTKQNIVSKSATAVRTHGMPLSADGSGTRGSPLLCSHSLSAVGSSRHMFLDSPDLLQYAESTNSGSGLQESTTTSTKLGNTVNAPAATKTQGTPAGDDQVRETTGTEPMATSTRTETKQSVVDTAAARPLNFSHIQRDTIHKVGVDEKHRKYVMQYIPNMRRPYYRIYLPQQDEFQLDNFLYCRKKRNKRKFRFSLSDIMTKKNNPMYEGKLTILSESRTERAFRLTDRFGNVMGEMNTVVSPEAHQMNVLIFPLNSSSSDDGKPSELVGNLQAHLDPRLTLRCNGKPILEMLHPSDHAAEIQHSSAPHTSTQSPGDAFDHVATATPTDTTIQEPHSTRRKSHTFEKSRGHRLRDKRTQSYQGNRQNKFLLEWVAPLSMFTSFAIACVAEDCIQAEAKNGDGTYFLEGKK